MKNIYSLFITYLKDMLTLNIIYNICGKLDASVSSINLLSKNINKFFVKNIDIYVRNLSYIERHILFLNACLYNKQEYIDATLPLVDPSINECEAINFAIKNNNTNLLGKLLKDKRVDFNRYMTPYLLGIYGKKETLKYLLEKNIYTVEVFTEVFKSDIENYASLNRTMLYIDYIDKFSSKMNGADYMELLEKCLRYLLVSIDLSNEAVTYMLKRYDLRLEIIVHCICNVTTAYEKFVILAEHLKKRNQLKHLSTDMVIGNSITMNVDKKDKTIYLLNNLTYTDEEMNRSLELYCYYGEIKKDTSPSIIKIFLESEYLKTLSIDTLRKILYNASPSAIEQVFSDPRSHYFVKDHVIKTLMDKKLTVLVSNLVNNKNIKLKENYRVKRLSESDDEFKECAEYEIKKRFRKN